VSDPVTLLLALVVFGESLWCIRAARRLAAVYQTRLFESLFFRRLVDRNKRVAYIGGGAITAVVIWSLVSFAVPELVPAIPRPWGTVLIAIALIVMLAGPILDDRYVQRVRKGEAK
jgi:hypothetical protein